MAKFADTVTYVNERGLARVALVAEAFGEVIPASEEVIPASEEVVPASEKIVPASVDADGNPVPEHTETVPEHTETVPEQTKEVPEQIIEACTLHVFCMPGDFSEIVTSNGPRLLDVKWGVHKSEDHLPNTWHE